MLEISYIRENKSKVIEALGKRKMKNIENKINNVLSIDEDRRNSKKKLDDLLFKSNSISKDIGDLFKQGKREEAEVLKKETEELKKNISGEEDVFKKLDLELQNLLYSIPNIPNDLVKAGKDENDNEIIYSMEIPNDTGKKLCHWELLEKYDLIDFKAGAKVAGAGFPIYKGKGAVLQRAMINYFLDKNIDANYEEVIPPFVINEASGIGTGQLPDKEGQMYHMAEDDLYLIPTAEVPVTNIYRDTILEEKDFPVKLTAYSPCFRREAGSYGKDVKGLNRLHQFDKVEVVEIQHPDKSWETLDNMVNHVRSILEELKLPFRILRLCGGDTGFTSSITYDFEVYSTAQKRWLEVSSVSNFLTYQSNRLKLRFKNSDGKNQLCHTLNGSSLALPRVLASLLEDCQTENGEIEIPEVLIPYTKFKKIK